MLQHSVLDGSSCAQVSSVQICSLTQALVFALQAFAHQLGHVINTAVARSGIRVHELEHLVDVCQTMQQTG